MSINYLLIDEIKKWMKIHVETVDAHESITTGRLTTAQRLGLIASNGMIVYDTDLRELFAFIDFQWVPLSSVAGPTGPKGDTGAVGPAGGAPELIMTYTGTLTSPIIFSQIFGPTIVPNTLSSGTVSYSPIAGSSLEFIAGDNINLTGLTGAVSFDNLSSMELNTSSGNTISIGNNQVELSFPVLKYIFSRSPNSNLSITSSPTFSMPQMISMGTIIYGGGVLTITGGLSSVNIGTIGVTKQHASTINIAGQLLDVATVNGILALLVSLDGTNGTTLWTNNSIDLSGGTSAAPTGQGILDKATLIGRGCIVTTN